MKIQKVLISILLLIILTGGDLSAHAKEGFSTVVANLPKPVVAAWNATFAIVTDSPKTYRIGTAFLVAAKPSGEIYFITVNHVVDPTCKIGETCPSTYLFQDLRFEIHANGKGHLSWADPVGLDQVELVRQSDNPDFAVLKAKIPVEVKSSFQPIPLSSNCDLKTGQTLFSVGFPAAYERTSRSSLPIMDKSIVTKRWTEGIYVDHYHLGEDGKNMMLFIGTTTDSLEGISGGPIVNADGELISLNVKSASAPENQFEYSGNEDDRKGKLDWQSLGIRCETVNDILQDLGISHL